jgi:hypothetical protein
MKEFIKKLKKRKANAAQALSASLVLVGLLKTSQAHAQIPFDE